MIREHLNEQIYLAPSPTLSFEFESEYEIDKPDESKVLEFNRIVEPIFDLIEQHQLENQKLTELKDLLLSKLATIEN